MDTATLKSTLHHLITTWENEVVEFKEAANDFDTDKIGRYVSALSIEANLRNQERAWLVFGVRNSDRQIVGTSYRDNKERLHSLKQQIAQDTEPGLTFREIYELDVDGLRVVMFEIPAAPRGIPISWKGQYCARNGEGLATLSLDKFDTVRNQSSATDWTAQVVPEATLDHLDPEAILRAREAFVTKHANSISADEIKGWSDQTFLDRAKLTQQGKLTRASILLLGKNESTYLLSPHPVQLTWKLVGPEEAYEHFGPPFFLSSTRLYKRIRNIQLRLFPDGELIPHEIPKYDQKVVLEALHNCIAHQDYSRNARIVVTEYPAKLVLENEGSFFEGKPEDYVTGERTPHRYRNTFLVQAMAELNMIDTMGRGIFRMHKAQRERYFPMPDYKVDGSVSMTIHGGVVDPAYTRLLMQKSGLPIMDVLALDRVQKAQPITDEVAKHLRREGLIEGRKPRYHVSAIVADATASRADYILTRAQDDEHYAKLLMDFLTKFGSAGRKEVEKLWLNKLSDALTEEQKLKKLSNLLTKLRRSGRIRNAGSNKSPRWEVVRNAE
jgi:ATP-dependent DNA helicase RecG